MVNLVAAQRPVIRGLTRMAGVKPCLIEIEPGTIMNFWVPIKTIRKGEKTETFNKPNKPVLVLVHGFAAEGIVTWQFQVRALTKKYSVYVPDLIFFGASTTDKTYRTPTFQAQSLVNGLRKLGVEKCTVVGFSYGGVVTFKMAELYPEMVQAMVITASVLTMNGSIGEETLMELGFKSSADLLMPSSVKGLKALLSVATHRKLWFPNKLFKDFLEVMFINRKERVELLVECESSHKAIRIPSFPEKIHLLWGENDPIFKLELAQNMKEQLGNNATFQVIKKAGHIVHQERPCVYNRHLKQFLASLYGDGDGSQK